MKYGARCAFIGTDGSGKSTTLNNIREQLPWPIYSRIIYMGDNQYVIPLLASLQSFKERTKNDQFWLSSLFFALSTFDKWIRSWIGCLRASRGELILFDRWFHDLLTNPKDLPGSWKYRIKQIVFRISPKPDLIVLLSADADTIYLRNQEFNRDHVKAAQSRYIDVIRQFEPEALIIDTAQSPDRVTQVCLTNIWVIWRKKWIAHI
jgi:thymidylate kinase